MLIANEPTMFGLHTQYEIGEWFSLTLMHQGWESQTYHLATSTGHYVLHRYSLRTNIATLTFEQDLIRYLFLKGFPVSEPLLTTSGQTYAVGHDGLYTLSICPPGEFAQYGNREHLAEAARTLAWYHRLVRNYRPREQREGFNNILYQIRESAALVPLPTPEGKLSFIEQLLIPTMVRSALTEAVMSMRAQANVLSQELDSAPYTSLPQLIVHGDFHRRHLGFERNQLKGVLSFSDAYIDARANDLAFAIWRFALVRGDTRLPGYKVWLDVDLVKAFVDAYREIERIEDLETRLIPDLIRAAILKRALRYYWPSLRTEPVELWAMKFPRDAKALRWLEANHVRILDALA
jgi:Ser/Thr protein kinase RdoA (MazF antagonist)